MQQEAQDKLPDAGPPAHGDVDTGAAIVSASGAGNIPRASLPPRVFLSRRFPEAVWTLFWLIILVWLWVPAPLSAKAISLAAFLLAAFSPAAFWIALAFALPWFGKDPGGPKPLYVLDMSFMALLIADGLMRCIAPVARRLSRLDPWLALYAFYSLACTQSSWWALEPEFYIGPFGFMRRIFEHYATAEVFGLHQGLGVLLIWGVYRVVRDRPWLPALIIKWVWALSAGFGLSVALGLLDYFGALSLEWWRPFNPDVVRFGYPRLMSLFWHSGWYAEYVSAASPVLIALGWYARSRAGRIAWWTFAALALFVQLLTFQRAGWFAQVGADAVVILGLCVLESPGRWAPRFVKIMLGFAGGVAALFAAIAALSPAFRHRIGEMLVYSDRTIIWKSAIGMWWPTNPLAGVGYGYYFRSHFTFYPFGHPYFNLDKVNAHNFYLHIAVERGLIGLALLLTMIAVLLIRFRPSRIKSAGLMQNGASANAGLEVHGAPIDLDRQERLLRAAMLGVFGGIVGTLINGFFQDPFYIRLMEALWWIWLGWSAWLVPRSTLPALRLHALLALAAALFCGWALVKENLWKYPIFAWDEQKRRMRSGGQTVAFHLPEDRRGLKLGIGCWDPTISPEKPLEISIFLNDAPLQVLRFEKPENQRFVDLQIPDSTPARATMRLEASVTWSPIGTYGSRSFDRHDIGMFWQLYDAQGREIFYSHHLPGWVWKSPKFADPG